MGRFFAIVVAVCVACSIVSVMQDHDPYIRYQSMDESIFWRSKWIYERIHFDPEPIEVAFFGSSRTNSAISSALLEAELAQQGHPGVRIVNFSLPASGLDIRYSLIRELLENRSVNIVVVSVVEQLPRSGHQAFGDLARVDEVLTAPWIPNLNLARNLIYLPMRQIKLAWMTRFPEELGAHRDFDATGYLGTTYDKWFTTDLPGGRSSPEPDLNPSIEELKNESRFRRGSLTQPLLPPSMGDLEFGVNREYLEEIQALCAEHETKLRILYLPFYDGWAAPLDLAYLERVAPVLNAGFIRENADFYNDVAHVNKRGAEAITPWLARQIGPLL